MASHAMKVGDGSVTLYRDAGALKLVSRVGAGTAITVRGGPSSVSVAHKALATSNRFAYRSFANAAEALKAALRKRAPEFTRADPTFASFAKAALARLAEPQRSVRWRELFRHVFGARAPAAAALFVVYRPGPSWGSWDMRDLPGSWRHTGSGSTASERYPGEVQFNGPAAGAAAMREHLVAFWKTLKARGVVSDFKVVASLAPYMAA